MMFGRRERKRPLVRENLEQLENLRDDCIALFINSGLRQKDITNRGGPTPQTISKWLYKETHFPRYSTIESFLMALGYGLTVASVEDITRFREQSISERLGLDIAIAGRPRMPVKKKRAKA
jgi:hypothetical protein